MKEFLLNPWPWYVVGPLITMVMVLFLYLGQVFGISSTMKHLCSVAGAGRFSSFFRYDWKEKSYSLFFALGMIIGGFLAVKFLNGDQAIVLATETKEALVQLGVQDFNHFVPSEIFGNSAITTYWPMYVIGGLLIGFGTRYANGCTSGHAIMGLSNLQLPSLIAVVGFFIGGLIATHFLLPFFI